MPAGRRVGGAGTKGHVNRLRRDAMEHPLSWPATVNLHQVGATMPQFRSLVGCLWSQGEFQLETRGESHGPFPLRAISRPGSGARLWSAAPHACPLAVRPTNTHGCAHCVNPVVFRRIFSRSDKWWRRHASCIYSGQCASRVPAEKLSVLVRERQSRKTHPGYTAG